MPASSAKRYVSSIFHAVYSSDRETGCKGGGTVRIAGVGPGNVFAADHVPGIVAKFTYCRSGLENARRASS